MSDTPVPGGLHPNLARIAASYDIIVEQVNTRRLSPAEARMKIAALEARDDQGVRWGLDAETGRFVRTAANGTQMFDTPPDYGYATHDAFAYTHPDPFAVADADGPRVEDPNARLELYGMSHAQLPQSTARPGNVPAPGGAWWQGHSTTTYAAAIAALLLLVLFLVL